MVLGVVSSCLKSALSRVLRVNGKSSMVFSQSQRNVYAFSGKLDITSFTKDQISVVTSARFAGTSPGSMDKMQLLSEKERREFNAVYAQLVEDLIGSPELRDMFQVDRWLPKVLDYNVPHGKRNRGLDTALAYRYLSNDRSPQNIHLSYVLGWCVEILQAFFLVSDDIMDGSETRRGQPCWYLTENLGLAGFNDALLLEASIYVLLKKYFRGKDYYVILVDTIHDATFKTIYGQSLDTRTGRERRVETYTLDLYSSIVKFKTSYYTFCLPVSLAMAMAGLNDFELRKQAEAITLKMGHFFQVQDDYLDCFGDEKVTGKIGTDIQDGKCSWVVVAALEKANAEQRRVLLDNYGKKDPENIRAVKQLYAEMGIAEQYLRFEEQNYASICNQIQQLPPSLPKELFHGMLGKIYRRRS